MAAEVVAGDRRATRWRLLSDAAHMLTDAVAIALALVALRLARAAGRSGGYTYGLQARRDPLRPGQRHHPAAAGGLIVFEAIRRLIDPARRRGPLVLIVALIGIPVNLVAAG